MDSRLLRLYQIIGDKKRGIPAKIPVSRSSWYNGISAGKYPPGFLLGPKTRVWPESEIEAIIENGVNAA